MPKHKERTTILAEDVRIKIKSKWPSLRQAMRELELTSAMSTDAFYRVMRGDLSAPHEVQLITTRWVFAHKATLEREVVEQILQDSLERIQQKTGKKIHLSDLVRDILIHDKQQSF